MHREFIISNHNDKFKVRFGRYFLFVLPFAAIVLAVGIYQQSSDWLIFPLVILLVGAAWCLFYTRSALYKIEFDGENRQVIVDILEFDKIKNRHIIPFEAFEASVHINLAMNGMPHVLLIYANNKLLYRQRQTYGWSYNDLYDIEEFTREIKG